MKFASFLRHTLVFGTALAAIAAQAQIVAFTSTALGAGNTNVATTVSATTLNAGFSSAIVARGSGLAVGAGTSRYNSSSWSTTEGTGAANDYVSITLNPKSGFTYSITQITFTVGSSSNINNWSLRSSLDNYATQISTGTFTAGSTSAVSITGTALSAFSNLSSTTQFRLYGWGASAAAGNTFGIGNSAALNFNGSVSAVPEPSTYAALAGAAALVGVIVHRRRQRLATKA